MSKNYTFTTKDGNVFTFPNESDMTAFAIEYTLGNLVAEGKMKYVTIEGKLVPQITQSGMDHFRHITGLEMH